MTISTITISRHAFPLGLHIMFLLSLASFQFHVRFYSKIKIMEKNDNDAKLNELCPVFVLVVVSLFLHFLYSVFVYKKKGWERKTCIFAIIWCTRKNAFFGLSFRYLLFSIVLNRTTTEEHSNWRQIKISFARNNKYNFDVADNLFIFIHFNWILKIGNGRDKKGL